MSNLPKWSMEFVRFLSVTPQFSFTGNILDVYPVDLDGIITTLRLKDYIRTILVREGYDIILTFEPFVGFSHMHGDPDTIHAVLGDVLSAEKTEPPSLERTIEIIRKSVENRTAYSAIILNQVSRPWDEFVSSDTFLYHLFSLCQDAEPRLLAGSSYPRFNLIIWIHSRDAPLPSWYIHDNTKFREIIVPKPNFHSRRVLLESLTKNLPLFESLGDNEKEESLSLLVKKTHNFQANELISLISLVRRDVISVSDLPEAVVQYTCGPSENFWKTVHNKLVEGAEEFLNNRVFGQTHAIKRICSLLSQSYLGLTHTIHSQKYSQPRGFFILAGHEGVGKTALIHALKDLLLGTAGDLIMVNMSDYQDNDAGKHFLVNASIENGSVLAKVRRNPYSIVVFDNIESASRKVMHLLNLIIREGELQTEDGTIIDFSGCLVICTIRLHGCCPDAYKQGKVTEETIKEYQTKEQMASEIIAQFFEEHMSFDFSQLVRGNTIIFRGIKDKAAKRILDSMLNDVLKKIYAKYHLMVTLSPEVRTNVENYCCQNLFRGGISINQRLEEMLVSPLSKQLIEERFEPNEKVIISHISDSESGWEVTLSRV